MLGMYVSSVIPYPSKPRSPAEKLYFPVWFPDNFPDNLPDNFPDGCADRRSELDLTGFLKRYGWERVVLL
jgi:hypothetical protein